MDQVFQLTLDGTTEPEMWDYFGENAVKQDDGTLEMTSGNVKNLLEDAIYEFCREKLTDVMTESLKTGDLLMKVVKVHPQPSDASADDEDDDFGDDREPCAFDDKTDWTGRMELTCSKPEIVPLLNMFLEFFGTFLESTNFKTQITTQTPGAFVPGEMRKMMDHMGAVASSPVKLAHTIRTGAAFDDGPTPTSAEDALYGSIRR